MVVILVIEIANPHLKMGHKLLPNSDIRVDDEGGQVVYVVAGLVEVFNGHRIGVPEADQVLKYECVVFPYAAPQNRSQGV